MKWIGISGSWRYSTPQLEIDLRREVSKIMAEGNGVVVGGALGVDFKVTRIVLKRDPSIKHIKIFLPTDLPSYVKHLNKRVSEGIISAKEAHQLIKQLETVKHRRPEAIIEPPRPKKVNQRSYYARNGYIVQGVDEIIAFQVNNSPGTENAVKQAHILHKKVTKFSYTVKN